MQIAKSALQIEKRGFTLIEVLIGTFLILIVFLGIFGAYRLGLKVVGLSKNKIIATAITNAQIEKIRNLSYRDLGTKNAPLPYAQGVLDSATTTVLNNLTYQIETKVKFIIDEADGTGAADSCNWDYKRAEVKVSWAGSFGGEVKLTTDVAPKDTIEEIQTCQAQPGGILSVLVFDAFGGPVPSPLMEVFNPETGERVDFATPADGSHDFPLATSTYKVVVSKEGYSMERTYGADEIATPAKPNPIILVGQITPISFSIDRLSSFSADTLSSWGTEFFSDTFSNESKISEKSNVVIANGEVNLATATEGYYPSGFLTSIAISPASLIQWDKFSFSDSRPANTDLRHQVYYASGTEWYLISDADLPGNSTGFDVSPLDLSSLATSTYSQLKLKANFSTNSTDTTPILKDWQISWITSEPTPVPNVTFNLQGEKIIGKDADENPVYKYSNSTTSDSNGHISLTDLEWDNYTFSVNPATGLDLVGTDPDPQPISLVPGANLPVKLYLDSQNSLLVAVQNIETLELVFSASVRLFNLGLAYDKTQYTNEKGQTYFIPLEPANYDLEIQAAGYNSTSTTVLVSGDATKTVRLEQIE